MKVVKYYQISGFQLFTMSLFVGIISAAIIIINIQMRDYLQLPEVTLSADKCIQVVNYKNGEAYTCEDVGVVLRNYRKKKV